MNQEKMTLFGMEFRMEKLNTDDLPLYLTAGRAFFKMTFSGHEFLLVRLSANERFGVIAFEKQAALLSAKYDMPAAFEFESISRAQRDSLIRKNVPFIAGSSQLYLPFLGFSLNERFSNPREIPAERMMPVTQALFLYLLYRSKGRPVMKKDAAEAIGATRTSITRASEQLAAMGLISQEVKGKEIYMTAKGSGTELYEKAKPYMINPVRKTITVENDSKYDAWPLSGESALAEKTMLNEPGIPVRAAWKAEIIPENMTEIDARWEPDEKPVELEIWKYNPCLFAKGGTVDPVSLALSFEGSADERIEGAVEDYLEEYQW